MTFKAKASAVLLAAIAGSAAYVLVGPDPELPPPHPKGSTVGAARAAAVGEIRGRYAAARAAGAASGRPEANAGMDLREAAEVEAANKHFDQMRQAEE